MPYVILVDISEQKYRFPQEWCLKTFPVRENSFPLFCQQQHQKQQLQDDTIRTLAKTYRLRVPIIQFQVSQTVF